jgi:hypothetical protein
MIDLKSFRRDGRAMKDGAWISPGPEYGALEIHTAAIGPRYRDHVAAAIRAAAKKHLSEERIPAEVRDAINTEALIATCLMDVRGLSDGGTPITFARFCDLIRDPEYVELNNAAFIAAGLVGRQLAEATEQAVGNSPSTSAITSAAPPPPMPG